MSLLVERKAYFCANHPQELHKEEAGPPSECPLWWCHSPRVMPALKKAAEQCGQRVPPALGGGICFMGVPPLPTLTSCPALPVRHRGCLVDSYCACTKWNKAKWNKVKGGTSSYALCEFLFFVNLECMHVCSDLRNIIQETFCFPKKALVSASSFILALTHKGSSPGSSVRLGRNLISYKWQCSWEEVADCRPLHCCLQAASEPWQWLAHNWARPLGVSAAWLSCITFPTPCPEQGQLFARQALTSCSRQHSQACCLLRSAQVQPSPDDTQGTLCQAASWGQASCARGGCLGQREEQLSQPPKSHRGRKILSWASGWRFFVPRGANAGVRWLSSTGGGISSAGRLWGKSKKMPQQTKRDGVQISRANEGTKEHRHEDLCPLSEPRDKHGEEGRWKARGMPELKQSEEKDLWGSYQPISSTVMPLIQTTAHKKRELWGSLFKGQLYHARKTKHMDLGKGWVTGWQSNTHQSCCVSPVLPEYVLLPRSSLWQDDSAQPDVCRWVLVFLPHCGESRWGW